MNRESQIAEAAALAGGEIVARYFRDWSNVPSETKAGQPSYNRVSIADIESEQAIVEVIRREFPTHAILGEESQATPLDNQTREQAEHRSPMKFTSGGWHDD